MKYEVLIQGKDKRLDWIYLNAHNMKEARAEAKRHGKVIQIREHEKDIMGSL